MSETEVHKGKLIPMILNGVTMEERCKSACEKLDITATGAHESWEEALRDRGYRTVFIRGDIIYKVENTQLDPYDDITEANKNADGSIDYLVSYYNGGVGFDEVIESAVDKVDKKDD